MATQPSEEQGKSNHAEPAADIEDVFVSFGSASPQSGGAPEISEEEVDEYLYRPLLQAASKGDWESAKIFFNENIASATAKITSRSETVLHIAAWSAQDQFVENLVVLLTKRLEVLEMVDCDGRTALHNAVLCGSIRMVKTLVTSNSNLTQLDDKEGRVPLGIAALEAFMHKEIAWFLAKSTTDNPPGQPFSGPSAIKTVTDLILNGHHDIALYLVRQHRHLIENNEGFSILEALAKMESEFPSGTRLSVLEALIYKCFPVDLNDEPTDKNSHPVPIIKRIHEVKRRHMAAVELVKQVCTEASRRNTTEITKFFQEKNILGEATARGISEIVKLCMQFFPELTRIKSCGDSLPTCAVQYRQERTLRLFLKVSSTNQLSLVPGPTDEESTTMMRAVAKYAATEYYPQFDAISNVAGAAFQMQRELQWYKAVEGWTLPSEKTSYSNEKTHWNMFVENRTELLKNGEKWVKDTANSCMLVSTLIATVLFAAAFTVPGGNDDKTGVPLLLRKDSLLIFAISDALGLFSSVTAILLFLAILTSRYEAQDFLEALPRKIIMGLCFLFLSLAFMLVAFTATLTIVLDKRLEWVLIPITLLASLPVALFVVLQIPLLYQMVKSTYGSSIFRAEGIWDGVKYTEQDQ